MSGLLGRLATGRAPQIGHGIAHSTFSNCALRGRAHFPFSGYVLHHSAVSLQTFHEFRSYSTQHKPDALAERAKIPPQSQADFEQAEKEASAVQMRYMKWIAGFWLSLAGGYWALTLLDTDIEQFMLELKGEWDKAPFIIDLAAFKKLGPKFGLPELNIDISDDLLSKLLARHFIFEERDTYSQLSYLIDAYQEACFNAAFKACINEEWGKIMALDLSEWCVLTTRDGQTLFLEAVKAGKQKCVVQFLDKFKDEQHRSFLYVTDHNSNTALHVAAANNQPELVDLLSRFFSLDEENSFGQAPIELAIRYGNTRSLSALVPNNPQTWPLLTLCVAGGQITCFETLLGMFRASPETAITLNQLNMEHETILHIALKENQFGMFEHLVTMHRDQVKDCFDQKSQDGKAPLHLACELGRESMIRTLAQAKANLNIKDVHGKTGVHYAVAGGHPQVIELLHELGAKLDIVDNRHRSPISLLDRPITAKEKECRARLEWCLKVENRNKTSPPNYSTHPPKNLAIQGGGPNGVTFIGALKRMGAFGDLREVERVAGSSAGAITATLLATGHSPDKIETLLLEKNLNDFLDEMDPTQKPLLEGVQKGGWFNGLKGAVSAYWGEGQAAIRPIERARVLYRNLVDLQGLCSGDNFRNWMELQIEAGTGIKHCTFGELQQLRKQHPKKYMDLHVFAIRMEKFYPAEIVRLSVDRYKDLVISDAVRCSMSIPGIFKPHLLHFKDADGNYYPRKDLGFYVDGGLLKNLPLDAFDDNQYQGETSFGASTNKRTLGIGLAEVPEKEAEKVAPKPEPSDLKAMLNAIWEIQNTLLQEHEYDRVRVMNIPIKRVGLTSFNLSKEKQTELIAAGEKAVDQFFHREGAPKS